MKKEVNISSVGRDSGPGKLIETTSVELSSRQYLLKDLKIGISISESSDLAEKGFGIAHLKDVLIEIARYILAHGGALVYGGDMRRGGFTELLLELLFYYKTNDDLPTNARFLNYLSWPLSINVSREVEAKYVQNVTFKKIAPPNSLGIKADETYLAPDSVENRYIWSECLTAMRFEMDKTCDARIFIGGRNKNFQGKYPGTLEELMIAISNGKPIFLIGAMGGVVNDILKALDGVGSATVSTAFHSEDKSYQAFYEYFNDKKPSEKISYESCFDKLKTFGFAGLSITNGLTIEENKRLAVTPHITEMIYLVLKGLTTKFQK